MEVVYQSANTTLIHGDCLEVMPTLKDGSVDVIWTDPPYGHNNHEGDFNAALNDLRGLEQQPIANDGTEEMRTVVDGMLKQACRVLNPVNNCCCCCCGGGGGRDPMFAWVAQRLDREGMEFFQAVVWDKLNPGLGWKYRRQYEFVMVSLLEKTKLRWPLKERVMPNVIRMSKPRDPVHPNEKPVGLISKFLAVHTQPGDLVLDPFCGSGTTMLAAVESGRKSIGIDIDRHWLDEARKRIEHAERQPLFDIGM